MAYLDQYDFDIFISYAHVDDKTDAGDDQGWVTNFVRSLKVQLARKLGRSDAYTLWMDHDLRNSTPITPQILDRVRRSAMLLILLSPGYIASAWCTQEREAFFQIIRERGGRDVFVVELDYVGDVGRPAELADINPFIFWSRNQRSGASRTLGWPQPKADDQEYYGAVYDLVHEVVDEMRRLRAAEQAADPAKDRTGLAKDRIPHATDQNESANGRSGWAKDQNVLAKDQIGPVKAQNEVAAVPRLVAGLPVDNTAEPPAAAPGQSTVYLAQVTDDLDVERNGVRRFLEQAGLRVVPRGWYSMEPAAFRRSAAVDIAAADLYVQLLSGVAGKRPPDLPEGYAQCQAQLALAAGKPVLQWRATGLDPASVEDDEHRALLESPTVRAEGIEDFKTTVCREAERLQLPQPGSGEAAETFVFVDMDSTDRALAEELCEILDRHGAGYLLPAETDDPGAYRQDLEKNLAQCNALIVIYGATTSTWVRNHLLESRKALASRALPLRALAVFQGPPSPKDRLPVKFPSMTVLDCQRGLNEAEIVRFLRSLEAHAA